MLSTNKRPAATIPIPVTQPLFILAVAQLTALSFHVPLSALTGPQRALVGVESALTLGLIVTIVSTSLYLLVKAWSGSGWKALAWISVGLLLFWHWNGLGAIGPLPHWLTSGLVLVACLAAVARFAENRVFRVAVLAVSVTIFATLTLVTVRSHLATPPPVVSVMSPFSTSTMEQTPDIVLIVLDGYARADVLESLYGFDNSETIAGLEEAGFVVPTSANTNYTWTHFSIASMLEMSYLIKDTDEISNSDLAALRRSISGDNQLVDVLKANGYTYVHGDTDHWLNTCGSSVDRCLSGPLVDLTADSLLAGTPIGQFLYPTSGDPTTALNLTRIGQLTDWDQFRSSFSPEPTFFFLHLVLPHPPLFLDEGCHPSLDPTLDGRYINLGVDSQSELAHRRTGYVAQVKCANSAILDFVDQVETDAVVVITADHGPDSLEPLRASRQPESDQLFERMGTFTAVRLPETCDGPPPDHQLVNTFRVVLGCLSNKPIELLEKRYFIAGYGGDVAELKDPDLGAEALTTYPKEHTQ